MIYKRLILIIGDVLIILLITIMGFASHGTLDTAGGRMLTTFIPFVLAWFLVAPFLGIYDVSQLSQPAQLWRPFWSMVLAAPMGALLRGLWQNRPIIPTFVLVIGGISSLAILAWRAFFWFLVNRRYG
ncbi:MAG: DUF3054 domain-containing protein [Anaerolineales bacterium]|jgi:hypothetical protein